MIKLVGIVGGGIMGAGIAEVVARSGGDVVLREVNEAAVEGAQRRLVASLDKAVRNGKLADDERDAIVGRVRFTDTLEDLADCDLVAEAAIEDEEAKTAIFAALGKVVQAGRAPDQQYVIDPDHENCRSDARPGTRRRNALLQPGTGNAAGGSHPVRVDV